MLRLAPFLLATMAVAQTTAVIPSQFAASEAPGLEQEPFGYNRARHVQYVDRSLLGALPNGAVITRLAYRRDTNGYTAATMSRTGRPGATPVWQMRLGNTNESALNPPATFPGVVAPGWTTVYTPKTTVFPNTSIPAGGGPANFDIQFVFDVPFVWTGGTLGIDHYCFDSNASVYNYFVDAIDTQPAAGVVDLLNPGALGCPAGENRATGFAPNPGGTMQMLLFGAPPSTVAFACLGFDDTTWGPFALPFHMAPLGAPTCYVHIAPLSSDLVVVDSGGNAEFLLPIPSASSYIGQQLLAQWAIVDDRINPAFPVTSSDALRFQFGAVPNGQAIPMSVVSTTGITANTNTGYVWPGRGAIFRLTF